MNVKHSLISVDIGIELYWGLYEMSVFIIEGLILFRTQMHLSSPVYSFQCMEVEFLKKLLKKIIPSVKILLWKILPKKDKKCANLYILLQKLGSIYGLYLQNLNVWLSRTHPNKELVQEKWKMLHTCQYNTYILNKN